MPEDVVPEDVVAEESLSPQDSSGSPDELTELKAERDQLRDELLRKAADMDNYKKQSAKRSAEEVANAKAGVIKQLLDVLDAFDAAIAQGVEGTEPLQSLLIGVLGGFGLVKLGESGEAFDPNIHEAVMVEPGGETSEQVVLEVMRAGYALNDRVLRHATVKVSG